MIFGQTSYRISSFSIFHYNENYFIYMIFFSNLVRTWLADDGDDDNDDDALVNLRLPQPDHILNSKQVRDTSFSTLPTTVFVRSIPTVGIRAIDVEINRINNISALLGGIAPEKVAANLTNARKYEPLMMYICLRKNNSTNNIGNLMKNKFVFTITIQVSHLQLTSAS